MEVLRPGRSTFAGPALRMLRWCRGYYAAATHNRNALPMFLFFLPQTNVSIFCCCCCWVLHRLFFRHARRGELHRPRAAVGHCFLRRPFSEPLAVVAKGVGTGEIPPAFLWTKPPTDQEGSKQQQTAVLNEKMFSHVQPEMSAGSGPCRPETTHAPYEYPCAGPVHHGDGCSVQKLSVERSICAPTLTSYDK